MDESISLNWNNYSVTFLENLKRFQNKECLCDSTIACQGKFYPVHRLVLSLCSEYFENIFERTPCKHPFIIVKDIEPIQLEALLNFIYQGEAQVSKKDLSDFMKAADTLKIKGLLKNNNQVVYSLNNVNNINTLNKQNNPNINSNSNDIFHTSSINFDPIMVPINVNAPANVKRKIKSAKKRNNSKKSKTTSLVKTKKVKSAPQIKSGNLKNSKLNITPLRKSSRESVPKISYYIPDEEIEENDSEVLSRDNQSSQITIASYSGGNEEEFDDSHAISDHEIENITIKVESTDYILDEINDLPIPGIEFESDENNLSTEISQESYSATSSEVNDKIVYQSGKNNFDPTIVPYTNEQVMDPLQPVTIQKARDSKKLSSVRKNVNGKVRPDYHCPYCGKNCLMNSLYQCHIRSHTGERPFSCPYCEYKATQKHHIKGHVKRIHKIHNYNM